MKMKSSFWVLATVFISLAIALPLKAELFDHSYSVYPLTDHDDFGLISEMLIGRGVALHPGGELCNDTTSDQIGIFSNLVAKVIPSFTNGVLLSTGKAKTGNVTTNVSSCTQLENEGGPNYLNDDGFKKYFANDLHDYSLRDPAGFILNIKPTNKTINIPFVMASEEFFLESGKVSNPPLSDYIEKSDKFAIFLQEAGDSLMTNNIALLPGGGAVGIASVNQHTNTEYFVSNIATNQNGTFNFNTGDINLPMEFNGAITGLVAVAEGLDTNKTYRLKIIIADHESNVYTSVLFLRANGITSGADLKIDVTGPAETLTEPGEVTFTNTVSNIGPAIADGVVVTNSLPEGATFVDCDCDPAALSFVTNSLGATNGLVWVIGNRFRPNSNAVMRVRCYLPDEAKTYKDSALVVTSTGDYDEKNNRAEADADVGGERREFDVYAVTVSKKYGDDYVRSGLEFIDRITGTNETDRVQGIKVTFTNQQNEVAWPTNATAPAGTYKIFLSKIEGLPPNAIIRYHEGDLTNECRAITIKANDTNKVYGTSIDLSTVKDAFTVLDEGDGLAEGELVTDVSIASDLALDVSTPAGTNYNEITVKPFEVSGTGGFDQNNYVITPSNGTLVVDRRAIEITPNNGYKTYGDSYPFFGDEAEFEISAGELVNGDSITHVELKSDGSGPKASWKEWYDITATNATGSAGLDENYTITYAKGKLGMDKFKFTITAADTNRFYGSSVEFTGKEFSVDKRLPNEEKVDTVTITGVAATNIAVTVGTYEDDIVPDHVVTGSNGFSTNNYEITFVRGDLTVTNAPLTIIANDTNKVYGAEFSFTGDEYTTDPAKLYNGDAITSLTLTSDGTNRTAGCGSYVIVVTNAFGNGLDNYDITYSNGTLTVTNAHLTIIANSTNRMYGTAIERFDGTEFTTIPEAGELPNGESVTKVTISCTWATNKFAVVKDYAGDIVPSHEVEGIDTNNYAITFEPGTLTVTNAHLTITANTTNKVYGESRPFTGTEFAITKGSLLDGDTITNVTLTCSATNAMAGCSNHVINVSNADGWRVKRNYLITYVPGEFKVKPFKITITADDTNKVYGSTVRFSGTEFSTEPKVEDFPNGETVTSVTLTSVGTNVSASVTNTYDIVPSHVVSGGNGFHTNNYEIEFLNGTLTVTQALLTVKASDAIWRIKKPRPSYGFENFSSQLAEGDAVADVTGGSGAGSDLEYTNRVWATGEPDKGEEGVYSNEIWIVLSSFDGPRATNYVIKVEPGDLTVDAALPELKASLIWELNGKGLFEGTLTVKNTGDGAADADSDYWVELIPGPATNGTRVAVSNAYYLASRTGTIPGGPGYQGTDYDYEYQDLTKQVKAELLANYGHTEFGTNESVTVTGISVYHWKRYNPSKGYFNTNAFFVVGHLYNPADKAPTDFRVSDDEKKAAAPLLDAGVSDYLEMTRLNLLPYYHWNTEKGTWIGPTN